MPRPAACSAFSRKSSNTIRKSMITRRCLTCSDSPGPESRCTPETCLVIPQVTVAFGLPYDFSQLLFKATANGGTVVVGDGKTSTPHLASNPGLLLAPKDFSPEMLHRLGKDEYDWRPERSPEGPITIVVSSADDALYVYRNGNPIGRGAVEVSGRGGLGNHVFTLLEGSTGKPSQLAPGREARRWMRVTSEGRPVEARAVGFANSFQLRVRPKAGG